MNRDAMIESIVKQYLDNMDLSDLEQYYIDMKTFELEQCDSDELKQIYEEAV